MNVEIVFQENSNNPRSVFMRRLILLVGTILALVALAYPHHPKSKVHGPAKSFIIAKTKQRSSVPVPAAVPVPQVKATEERFDIIAVDGQTHIIRSPGGHYKSILDLPASVRTNMQSAPKHQASTPSVPPKPARVAAAFVVSDPGDGIDVDLTDGVYSPATLRSAIQNANKLGGAQTILFAPGMTVIQPQAALPGVTAALTIDGTVNSGKIILDGSATTGQVGLSLSNTSAVTNMVFRSWSLVGLGLTAGAVNSVVDKCEFTLNTIGLNINANGTSVGDYDDADRNSAYGNKQDGIDITNANFVKIINNFCGTRDGATASPNTYDGIYVSGNDNEVLHNVLSGNQQNGLEIGQSSKRTYVEDNLIGVDVSGSHLLSNTLNGINTFAFGDSLIGNIISGNGYGITVLGQASQTYISGNLIGPNKTLDSVIGNRYGGLQIMGTGVTIETNVVCGNTNSGIVLTGPGGTVVKGNFIGTVGNQVWGNTGNGIYILSNNNVIGGQGLADQNTISGNGASGIYMYGGTTLQLGGPSLPNYVRGNMILHNFIGTGSDGTTAIPNKDGIYMQGYVDSNFVQQNVISANEDEGIWLSGTPTRNVIAANYIGTDDGGNDTLGNGAEGILITQAASNNVVEANVISGNGSSGVTIQSASGKTPTDNVIIGNTIGLDFGRTDALPNVYDGVLIWQACNTRIGGLGSDSANVITGNGRAGVTIYGDTSRGNMIRNNLIGISNAGNVDVSNGVGINIQGSKSNVLGGTEPGSGNTISGNNDEGVYLYYADSNTVLRNIIGLDPSGTTKKANGTKGIAIHSARGNSIGDSLDADGNIVSGNDEDGIEISGGLNNKITHNFIGTDRTKTLVLENEDNGVYITGASQATPSRANTISANAISYNGDLGINLGAGDSTLVDDTLDADEGDNELQNYPVLLLVVAGPQVSISGYLPSYANAPFRLEFFSNDSTALDPVEGKNYLGASNVVTNQNGLAPFHVVLPAAVASGMLLTATATDSAGNTSEFSHAIRVQPSGVYADLAVTVTANAHSLRKADTLVYHLILQNNGPDSATQVVLKDTLSHHSTFISDSASAGNATFSQGLLTFTISSLGAGANVSLTLVVKADSVGTLVNKAYASALEADPYPGNNVGIDTSVVSAPSAANDGTNALPLSYELKQNYPNPFNPSTVIKFDVARAGHVHLAVYDVLGRIVTTLVDDQKSPGRYSIEWNAGTMSSGVYYYRIRSGNFTATKKLILLK